MVARKKHIKPSFAPVDSSLICQLRVKSIGASCNSSGEEAHIFAYHYCLVWSASRQLSHYFPFTVKQLFRRLARRSCRFRRASSPCPWHFKLFTWITGFGGTARIRYSHTPSATVIAAWPSLPFSSLTPSDHFLQLFLSSELNGQTAAQFWFQPAAWEKVRFCFHLHQSHRDCWFRFSPASYLFASENWIWRTFSRRDELHFTC